MIIALALALVYVSTMDGCRENVPVEPPVQVAPALAFGDYAVSVTGVQQVSCRGARPEEFMGLVADGWLAPDERAGGEAVRFDLDGLLFRGGMAEGMVRLEGALGAPPPPVASEAGASTDAACASAERGGSSACAPYPDEPPPSDAAPSARITAAVIDAGHATGVLAVHTADCSYTLDIAFEAVSGDTAAVEPEPLDTGAVEPGSPGADDTGAASPGEPDPVDTGADDVPPGEPDCG